MLTSSSPQSGKNGGVLPSSPPGTAPTAYSPEYTRKVNGTTSAVALRTNVGPSVTAPPPPGPLFVGQSQSGAGSRFALPQVAGPVFAPSGQGASGLSANAAGKLPVAQLADSETPEELLAGTHRDPVFLDEFSAEAGDYISRYLIINQYPEDVLGGQEFHAIEQIIKQYQVFKNSIPLVTRNIRIKFDNLRDGCTAKAILNDLGYGIDFTTPHDFAMAKYQEPLTLNLFEGQVRLTLDLLINEACHVILPLNEHEVQELTDKANNLLLKFGDVRECELVSMSVNQFIFRAEYFSVMAANRIVGALGRNRAGDTSAAHHIAWHYRTEHWTSPTRQASPDSGVKDKDNQGRLVGYLLTTPPAGPSLTAEGLSRGHPADVHNRVRRDRILDGSDVRTTIMIRNCPNRMDWLQLKEVLEEHCFGTYDFMYLRIDFSTASNVGYAFVNFTEMSGIIALLNDIEGRPWIGYRSAKSAEISYATVQGKEALVQKFRNSSVMHEAAFCRPRIFWGYNEAVHAQGLEGMKLVGTEIDFPGPDNPAKLQRSMESARTVGLYPPHQNFSGVDHRNRFSMFDRGARDRNQQGTGRTHFEFTPELKRMVQAWHYHQFRVPIHYHAITSQLILQFLNDHPWVLSIGSFGSSSGVIGRSQYQVVPTAPHVTGPANNAINYGVPDAQLRTLYTKTYTNNFRVPVVGSAGPTGFYGGAGRPGFTAGHPRFTAADVSPVRFTAAGAGPSGYDSAGPSGYDSAGPSGYKAGGGSGYSAGGSGN